MEQLCICPAGIIVNCVSQLLITIPTPPATPHTCKCPQPAVGEAEVLSPGGVRLRCQGASEISRNWSQKPSEGQHLTEEPGSWSRSLNILWAIPCQEKPMVGLS